MISATLTLILIEAFRLTHPIYRSKNGSIFTNHEIVMIGLARYSSPGSVARVMKPFCRDTTSISRAISIFNKEIIANCMHLLSYNWEYWKNDLPIFAGCIGNKMVSLSNENSFKDTTISCLFDCTVIAICRPSSTPLNDHHVGGAGPNNYSGWKHHHGIKYLSVEGPNGM
jgi:hypothetical protein